MLYVTKLVLRNIRAFSNLQIDFQNPECCAVIIGDNGDGKSTLLRSLAMGLCDQSSASALFRELPGEFVRRDSPDGESFIQVDLVGRGGWRYRIRTEFIALDAFERIEQRHYRARGKGRFTQINQDDFPWSDMFVSAYGAGIRTVGNAEFSYYLPVDAVYPLFKYDAALQTPELVIRRLVDEAGRQNRRRGRDTLRRLRNVLAYLLSLKSYTDISLTRRGIFVKGPWGREELASLGDGYRATATWILDFISWWLLYSDSPAASFMPREVRGIAIVDELEQHLHPRWQRTILPQLRKLFPNTQFIVATHSPLIASSCDDATVHRLQHGEHTVHDPYGWRAEDVYEMMGVPTSRAAGFEQGVLSKFERLDQKRLAGHINKSELAQLDRLKAQLERLPSDDPSRLMIELHNMARSLKKER